MVRWREVRARSSKAGPILITIRLGYTLIEPAAQNGGCSVRLSNERCLELVRGGIRDVLMREVKSDDGRNAGRIILRTIDELLMRERAARSAVSTDIDRAIEKC